MPLFLHLSTLLQQLLPFFYFYPRPNQFQLTSRGELGRNQLCQTNFNVKCSKLVSNHFEISLACRCKHPIWLHPSGSWQARHDAQMHWWGLLPQCLQHLDMEQQSVLHIVPWHIQYSKESMWKGHCKHARNARRSSSPIARPALLLFSISVLVCFIFKQVATGQSAVSQNHLLWDGPWSQSSVGCHSSHYDKLHPNLCYNQHSSYAHTELPQSVGRQLVFYITAPLLGGNTTHIMPITR